MKNSGIFRRAMAFLLDIAGLGLILLPGILTWNIFHLFSHEHHHFFRHFDPAIFLPVLIILAYFIASEGILGFTPGKYIMHLRVVNEKGEKLSMKQSVIRNVLRLVDGLPFLNLVGIIALLVTKGKQRIGDAAATTYVIKID